MVQVLVIVGIVVPPLISAMLAIFGASSAITFLITMGVLGEIGANVARNLLIPCIMFTLVAGLIGSEQMWQTAQRLLTPYAEPTGEMS